MKIESAIQIHAGGPGSGRHGATAAHEAIKSFGYKRTRMQDDGVGKWSHTKSVYKHPNGKVEVTKYHTGSDASNNWALHETDKSTGKYKVLPIRTGNLTDEGILNLHDALTKLHGDK